MDSKSVNTNDLAPACPAIPDVSAWPLDEVLGNGDTPLDHCVRRLLSDSTPGEVIAAFSSSVRSVDGR
ncbi:MAG TPA: hypothetical protein VES42_16585 [Pilimelia sp.]|nr:hypothetical protein [Pilimelia sp.]